MVDFRFFSRRGRHLRVFTTPYRLRVRPVTDSSGRFVYVERFWPYGLLFMIFGVFPAAAVYEAGTRAIVSKPAGLQVVPDIVFGLPGALIAMWALAALFERRVVYFDPQIRSVSILRKGLHLSLDARFGDDRAFLRLERAWEYGGKSTWDGYALSLMVPDDRIGLVRGTDRDAIRLTANQLSQDTGLRLEIDREIFGNRPPHPKRRKGRWHRRRRQFGERQP